MKKIWEDFDNKLYTLLERKNKNKDFTIMADIVQKDIDKYILEKERIKEVFKLLKKNYNLEIKFLKSIFSPKSNIFNLKDEDILLRFESYIKIFGNLELLCKVIKQESYYEYSIFTGKGFLFNSKKEDIEERIQKVANILGLTKEQTIIFMINNVYYLCTTPEYLTEKIECYAKLLNTNYETIRSLIVKKPDLITTAVPKLENRIEGLSEALGVDKIELSQIILKYPPFCRVWKSTLKEQIRVLNKLGIDKSAVIKYPYLINLIDIKNHRIIWDISFEKIAYHFDYINNTIGEINEVYSFRCAKQLLPCCLVENGKKLQLIFFNKVFKDIECKNKIEANDEVYVFYDIPNKTFFTNELVENILNDIEKILA